MSPKLPAYIKVLLTAELGLGLLHVGSQVFGPLHHSLERFVNLNKEGNLPSWFASTQLTLVGLVYAAFALREFRKGLRPWVLPLLAVVFVGLSLDETAQIHERIGTISDALLAGGTRAGTTLFRTGIWPLLLGPLALLTFWAMWRSGAPYIQGQAARWKIAGGLLLFLFSATLPELASNFSRSSSADMIVHPPGGARRDGRRDLRTVGFGGARCLARR